MSELSWSDRNILTHLSGGGLIAIASYGKTTLTVEVLSRPTCVDVGIKRIAMLGKVGLVRYGDPSPYRSGTVTPIVLTEAGKEAIRHRVHYARLKKRLRS